MSCAALAVNYSIQCMYDLFKTKIYIKSLHSWLCKKIIIILDYSFDLSAARYYKDGDVRLIGGSYPWEGRVEIYLSRTWGTITDSDWTSDDAQAVCHELGYFKPGIILSNSNFV